MAAGGIEQLRVESSPAPAVAATDQRSVGGTNFDQRSVGIRVA